MKKLAVIIFGCLGRSLHITHKNHKERILNKINLDHDLIYVNNHTQEIDGVKSSPRFREIAKPNLLIELNQEYIDSKILKTHPHYKDYFKDNYINIHKKNPLRNSYIETIVSKTLNSPFLTEHTHALVFCADFWLEKYFDESWLDKNGVVTGDQNPGGGYTNGFYAGKKEQVSKLLDSFYDLKNLSKLDYEGILKLNAKKHRIPIFPEPIRFLKIRANGDLAYRGKKHSWKKIKHIESDYINSKQTDNQE